MICNKIGTIFKYKNVILKVVPQTRNKPICIGCYFSKIQYYSCYRHGHACTPALRFDNCNVIFECVKII